MVGHSQDSVERLRRIPLADVIPAICPGAYRSRERQGLGRVRWVLPDGTKVNVFPLADGDLFRFMNRSNDMPASVSKKGAINFVMAVRQTSFMGAVRLLDRLRPVMDMSRPDQRLTNVRPTILRHPERRDDPEGEWTQVRDYLVGERRLPDLVVADLYRRGHVYVGAGFYQGYLVFPHRADGPQSRVTGYSLRWAQADAPPDGKPTKWVASGSRLKDGWFHLGHSRQTLIITESPIDAITLWASAIEEGVAHRLSIRSSSGAGGLSERMWAGFEAVVAAFDNDAAGRRYAEWVTEHRGEHETTCVRPPNPYKDWNAAWQAGLRELLNTTRLWDREVTVIRDGEREVGR
ncbi:toprim domain-containing protein [Sulfobacillus harzensis]|uniref:Toprim domain-containing protein n=1 Tax=Sulfobacillus harzensis TaxID=2729629 RepID=A0A7Y0Q3E4_9FIRM|nr:toprim domain-containing protein [Sulfobacillus harzensis]NMP23477.1 hypothetical protein [Sulfobacillus harzensis]